MANLQHKFYSPRKSTPYEGGIICKKPSKTVQNYTFLGKLPNALKSRGIYFSYTTDYYPFGSVISSRSYSSGAYRFGFNGKEKDNETLDGAVAFEARIFDSRLGRFMSLDPRMSEYAWQTPYAYYMNSPVSVLDIAGMGGPYEESGSMLEDKSIGGDNINNPTENLQNVELINSVNEELNKPPKKEKEWKTREDLPRKLRKKYDAYKNEYDQMKINNPINANENIQAYEDRIAKLMMASFGTEKWMWYKINNRSKSNGGIKSYSTGNGQASYIWVGGLVIPEAQEIPPSVPIILVANGIGLNGASYSTTGVVGIINLTIQNLNTTSAAILTANYFTPPNNNVQFANNVVIPANGNLQVILNSDGGTGNIIMNWQLGPGIIGGMNFLFQVGPQPIRTFPLLLPFQTASKRASYSELQTKWLNNYSNKTIWAH